MPVSVLVADSLSKDILKQLMKTTRPFYHKSLDLVVACRGLPHPASDERAQIKEWNELLKGIESTLAWGVKRLTDKEIDAANKFFEDQYDQVNAYIKKYHLPKAKGLEWGAVTKKDRMAEGLIKKVKADIQNKMEDLKSIPTWKMGIYLWPEIPRKPGTKRWTYESLYLPCAVQIETTATLDILLHRLLESKSLLNEHGDHWKSLSLKHNPQFYLTFPDNTDHFKSQRSSSLHIPAVTVRNNVTKFKTLHVIVDRANDRQISLRNRSKISLPDRCGNGWPLDDEVVSIAVKLKGLSPAIVVWNTECPFINHQSHPSAITLIDDPDDSGSSLSQEELDSDFSDSVEAHSQTISNEGASGFHLPTWDNPSNATLSPSGVVMPTPCLPETRGSSQPNQTTGSPLGPNHNVATDSECNNQIQMPVPTPTGVGQTLNPTSTRVPLRIPAVINVNASPATPSSPAIFNAYISPISPSMRMVESDSPATPTGGFRGWFKKKLQSVAGR